MARRDDPHGSSGDPSWMPNLRGRTVIVTGASSGIGVATAQAVAEAGANVVLVGRDEERLARCEAQIRSAGGSCHGVDVDLTAAHAADRIVDEALRRFEAIDGLVNNAGIFEHRPFLETPVEVLDEQYRTNLRAPYALTRAVAPHMAPGSTIVFVTSNAAHGHFDQMAAYAASKGGEESLARALALELAPLGIRVNAVAPGLVHSPMTSRIDADPQLEADLVRLTPLGRLGWPSDIAAAVVFLCSSASAYALGAVLTVDGGWTIR